MSFAQAAFSAKVFALSRNLTSRSYFTLGTKGYFFFFPFNVVRQKAFLISAKELVRHTSH